MFQSNNAGLMEEDPLEKYYKDSTTKQQNKQSSVSLQQNIEQENDPLESYYKKEKPQRSTLEKATAIPMQFGLGYLENKLLPYELAVAPLASRDAQNMAYRQGVGEDIERLMEQKSMGQWDQQDQELLENLQKQIQDPEESAKFVKTADIGSRALLEKATGLDLQPKTGIEKAANWIGFIKDPKNVTKLTEIGLKPKEVVKAITPTGTELLRGAGAGTALQMAEDGQFGPIGTMASLLLGDLMGAGVGGLAKGASKLVKEPKKTLASAAAMFTPAEKTSLQKEIIKDFRDANIQADLGTITDSNLVKMIQSRLAQSGLTGEALDKFKNELTGQIKEEYKALADTLGESKFSSIYEAGQVAKDQLKEIRDVDLSRARGFYSEATKSLKEQAFVDSKRLNEAVTKLEKQLQPGQIKGKEQKIVLDTLQDLKRDISDSTGKPIYANVKDLINNKIALNDIINYEAQGGAKQLLKNIVGELDRSIISHGRENHKFAKNYIQANKNFSEHAKTFRNQSVSKLLREENPEKYFDRMNSVHGIRELKKILESSSQGKEVFRNLKRLKLDKMIGDNLVDSTTQQVKLSKFSKLLEKGKNRDLVKELLDPPSFQRLEKLQKSSGRLAEAADKFYNTSKSGIAAADIAIMSKFLYDVVSLLSGNPWPLLSTTGAVLGTKQLSNLMADPQFLKLVEDAIIATEKGSQKDLLKSIEKLRPYILPMIDSETSSDLDTNP